MLLIDVLDRQQHPAVAQFLVRRDSIETRFGDTFVGSVERELFREWLCRPRGLFVYGGVELHAVPAGIALSIQGCVVNWVLAPYAQHELLWLAATEDPWRRTPHQPAPRWRWL
jgi:hypothetical protein